ncbi:MAG TPA: hypothetical protein VN083_05755 [Vicinamibacteria bacterium]|nr:hypothetical protein [Vicinamibacteria bacterium]
MERHRIEGYLPRPEFRAQLEMGLARLAFMRKRWAEAERRYSGIVSSYPETAAAPEAMYWAAVSHYRGTNDHTVLSALPAAYARRYPESVWAKKASPWAA